MRSRGRRWPALLACRFARQELAMWAQVAKLYGLLPHELAWGRRDIPGEDIEVSQLIFDIQCSMAFGLEREEAAKKARKRR